VWISGCVDMHMCMPVSFISTPLRSPLRRCADLPDCQVPPVISFPLPRINTVVFTYSLFRIVTHPSRPRVHVQNWFAREQTVIKRSLAISPLAVLYLSQNEPPGDPQFSGINSLVATRALRHSQR
jgi:hypothetical protein